jgi:hypothetical protein
MPFFDSGAIDPVMGTGTADPAGGTKGVDARLKCGHDHADRFAS